MSAGRTGADLDDLVIVLLASSLAWLRDRLLEDGLDGAAELVSDLVDIADDHVARMAAAPRNLHG